MGSVDRLVRPGADREFAVLVLRFVLAELPVLVAGVLFWLTLIARFPDIGAALQVMLVVALVLAALGAFFLTKDQWRRVQRAWLERRVAGIVAPKSPSSSDAIREWLAAVPSAADLRAVETLCAGVAADWASDGVITYITYYIASFGGPLRIHVQPHAYSQVRSETCDLHLGRPRGLVDTIEPVTSPPARVTPLVEWPHWREAWLAAIEAAARIVDESDFAQMQVMPFESQVRFTAHGDLGIRHNKMCVVLRSDGDLVEEGGRLIRRFES